MTNVAAYGVAPAETHVGGRHRLEADQGEVWFTGDISFTAATMGPDAPTAGVHTDMRAVRTLHAMLKDRYLLLPSHDPTVPSRLASAGH